MYIIKKLLMFEKLNSVFMDRLKEIYSKDELKIIEKGFSAEKRKTSFRVNTLKSNNEEVEQVLKDSNIGFEKISFLSNGYVLTDGKEKDLWDLDISKKGKIYLQGITSQIPVELVEVKKDMKVLDLTAAPGAKTSQMAAKMNNLGEIVACEMNAIRCEKLKFTTEKQGVKNVEILKGDVNETLEKYIDGYFDVILFDAPCSAEGRINLNTDKIWPTWTTGNVKKHYKIQKSILEKNIKLLKPGGQLVYSTCTLAPEENESLVHFLLCNYPELELVDVELSKSKFIESKSGIKKFGKQCYKSEISKTLRFLPTEYSEGFYVAKLKKI